MAEHELLTPENQTITLIAEGCVSRAAVERRKAMASAATMSTSTTSSDQIIELFNNCIKLASENKITQKNSWELKLIDYLSEIIKLEIEDDAEVDFQKASCTLEAGVRIYSYRVDSAYSEAYKVLGRIIRAGRDDEQEVEGSVDNIDIDDGKSRTKKETERKVSPMSTIKQSFETFNAKKFDVDTPYYRTTTQFHGCGARGLLLNNLGVYGACKILFDSKEVPGKCIAGSEQHVDAHIDISFCREWIEQMVINIPQTNQISPSLSDIICQFDVDNQCSSHQFTEDLKLAAWSEDVGDVNVQADGNWSINLETATYSYEETRIVDDSLIFLETATVRKHQENDSREFCNPDTDGSFQELAAFMLKGLGFPSKHNAWAGHDHWKFTKHKASEDALAKGSTSGFSARSLKHNKISEPDLSFTNSLGQDLSNIFAPPRVPRTILLPVNRKPFKNKITEGCHYQPEDLLKLFLLPNSKILEKRRSQQPDSNSLWKSNSFGQQFSGSNASGNGGQSNDEYYHSDFEDSVQLASQADADQVNKIDVQYDKTSKEVDVQVLKESLWHHILEAIQMPEVVNKDPVSFKHVLATFPCECPAAVPGDISPHLCFFCLLHLANEHSLIIKDFPDLDDLSVYLPSSSVNVS